MTAIIRYVTSIPLTISPAEFPVNWPVTDKWEIDSGTEDVFLYRGSAAAEDFAALTAIAHLPPEGESAVEHLTRVLEQGRLSENVKRVIRSWLAKPSSLHELGRSFCSEGPLEPISWSYQLKVSGDPYRSKGINSRYRVAIYVDGKLRGWAFAIEDPRVPRDEVPYGRAHLSWDGLGADVFDWSGWEESGNVRWTLDSFIRRERLHETDQLICTRL